jgi:hypothetical protein
VIGVVEIGQLVEVIWVSLLAGVGITAAFSLIVLGTGHSAAARRAGRSGAALAYGSLAVVFFIIFAAAIVLGVQIMLSKG